MKIAHPPLVGQGVGAGFGSVAHHVKKGFAGLYSVEGVVYGCLNVLYDAGPFNFS